MIEKKSKKGKSRYITEDAKKFHFIIQVEHTVNILDRQINKLMKIAHGTSYSYNKDQIEKLTEYLNKRIILLHDELLKPEIKKETFKL
jgi:hypothetical protein